MEPADLTFVLIPGPTKYWGLLELKRSHRDRKGRCCTYPLQTTHVLPSEWGTAWGIFAQECVSRSLFRPPYGLLQSGCSP